VIWAKERAKRRLKPKIKFKDQKLKKEVKKNYNFIGLVTVLVIT